MVKGDATVTINHETMKLAMEEYINRRMLVATDHVTVVSVTAPHLERFHVHIKAATVRRTA